MNRTSGTESEQQTPADTAMRQESARVTSSAGQQGKAVRGVGAPFVLEARDIRGQMSNGMLASPHELGISDDHDGILEINEASQRRDNLLKNFTDWMIMLLI